MSRARVFRLRGPFVSLLLWEGQSLTYAVGQAGHSVATLAKHYAGTLEELEDKPRTPAADAMNAARHQLMCAQIVRRCPTDDAGDLPNSLYLWEWAILGSNQ